MWLPDRRVLMLGLSGLAGASLLTGCGFKLRGTPPMSFQTIALTGFAPRSPMAEAIQRSLADEVRVVDAPAAAQVVLQVLADRRERNIVATTSAAQVREVQLLVALQFRAHTPAGRELLPVAELTQTRDLTFAESAALAKEHEENELFRDMQADVVAQLMRRLAAIRL
jgi:LPS-assembly lipoprotein